jgi:hypothetical protein
VAGSRKGATVQTVDGTGNRITATRLFLTGPFALAMKKKTGALSVVVGGADGDSRTVKVPAKKARPCPSGPIVQIGHPRSACPTPP